MVDSKNSFQIEIIALQVDARKFGNNSQNMLQLYNVAIYSRFDAFEVRIIRMDIAKY
jgi:hypothetical protein